MGLVSRGGNAGWVRVVNAVAASSEWIGPDGVRQPGGEVHAWRQGTNQTVCGLALSRSRLRRFPHVPFDFRHRRDHAGGPGAPHLPALRRGDLTARRAELDPDLA